MQGIITILLLLVEMNMPANSCIVLVLLGVGAGVGMGVVDDCCVVGSRGTGGGALFVIQVLCVFL